jgi:hypothetical protein
MSPRRSSPLSALIEKRLAHGRMGVLGQVSVQQLAV